MREGSLLFVVILLPWLNPAGLTQREGSDTPMRDRRKEKIGELLLVGVVGQH